MIETEIREEAEADEIDARDEADLHAGEAADGLPPGVRREKVGHPVHGVPFEPEVAEVPGLGKIAKWPMSGTDRDGSQLHYFYKFSENGKRPEYSLDPLRGPRDTDLARFERKVRVTGGEAEARYFHTHLDLIDPTRGEVDRFRSDYPLVHDALVSAGVLAAPLRNVKIPPGLPIGVWIAGLPLACTAAAIVDALTRHGAGDLGDFGRPTGEPVSDLQIWSLPVQPRAIKNKATLATRRGVAVGRYTCPERRTGRAGEIWIASKWEGGPEPTATWAGWFLAGTKVFEE